MRLFARLSLFLVVVGIVPLLFTGFMAVSTATIEAVEGSEEQLERDAMVRAEILGRWTRDQARFLAGWSQLYPRRLATMDSGLQDGLLKAVWVAMPSAVVVALVDADGLTPVPPRFSPTGDDRPAADGVRAQMLVSRLPLSQALGGGAHLGDPYLPDPDGVPSVPIAVLATAPVEGAGPEETLVLGAEITLEVVEEILAQSTEEIGFAVLDGSGNVLAGAEHPLVRPRLIRALSGTTARFAYDLEAGDAVIGAVAPVPGTDWSMVVVRPESLVTESAATIRRRTLAVLWLSVAAALFLGWYLAQWLVDPVERLRDAALAVADGEYGRRTTVARQDELGELARAFNHMSERLAANQRELRAQQEEIEAFNRELQDRVERRTRELRDAQSQLVRSGQLAAVAEIGAGLAHELNNPLAAILGLSQVLRARRADDRDARLLRDLEEQAERCREVVATLLRFSSGEVDPGKAPVVDLRDVLREVSTLVRGPFRQRGVTLELVEADTAGVASTIGQRGASGGEPAAGALPVRIDPVHASRILAQILNALRAGLAEGATLRVSARVAGGEVEVRLDPDEPIAVDETRRDDWMASGLGLWVARRLLHELGGRLEQPLHVGPRPEGGGQLQVPGTGTLGEQGITEEVPRHAAPSHGHQDGSWRVYFPGA